MAISKELLELEILNKEEEDDDLLLFSLLTKKLRDSPKNMYKRRIVEGFYKILIEKHLNNDEEIFRQYCRLNYKQFDFVLSLISNEIRSKVMRHTITPREKLFLTLRFLATGETYRSLSFAYRISACHIGRIVTAVLTALSSKLRPIFLPMPSETDFKRIAKEFWDQWQFPNCIGAIDGKHVRMKCPYNSASLFYSYKEYFTTVLLAMVDANKKFIAVDIGSYGKEGDSGIFKKSAFCRRIESNQFNIPNHNQLPGTNVSLPYVLVADDAFGLDSYMMKPYQRPAATQCASKAIFNYRLCRARRVSENGFGLLSQIFRIYYTPIAIDPETCDSLIMTTCCLHNMLREAYLEKNNISYYAIAENVTHTENMIPLARVGGFANASGFTVRYRIKDFFLTEAGSVSWQDEIVNRQE